MSCPRLTQDPLDKRQVTVDFTTWLGSGVTISSVSWVVATGLTEASSSNDDTSAVNYFSGGEAGQEYEVACTITTDEAIQRKKTQRFIVAVENPCV